MANLGDRFKTGERCPSDGLYLFDGHTDGVVFPIPTQAERLVQIRSGSVFPPVRSSERPAFWKLQRIG